MSNNADLLFTHPYPEKEVNESSENELLFKRLCNPNVALKVIKDRDIFVEFSVTSSFEKHLDEILLAKLKKTSTPQISDVYIVSPTRKCLNIYKMLNNIVCIESSGNARMWSGFNVEYEQRQQSIDLKKFLAYLWYDQLLNHNDGTNVCKFKLEKYVRGILSKLNCLTCPDTSMIERIVEHVQERYISDIESIVSTGVNSFMFQMSVEDDFKIFLEWIMILGAVPYLAYHEIDNQTVKRLHAMNACFSDDILKHILGVRNKIPPICEVAVILCRNELECWHLPTKTKMCLFGRPKIRIENKEICLGTQGESLFYAELQLMHLAEKHLEGQCLPKYIVTEKVTKSNEEAKEKQKLKNNMEEKSLFAALTKTEDKNKNMLDYISRISTEMDELNARLNLFLDNVSPERTESLVDSLVNQGLESYLQKLKPKMDEWDRTIRDHLNKFRMNAIKHMTTLPTGMYDFQARATELNFNNTMDVEEFMEELSSNNMTRNKGMCNVSDLQEFDKTGEDLKQMQEKIGQYFELATKFMGYLKQQQSVISNLHTSDSVKELQIKALTDEKKEIVKTANRFKEVSNKQMDIYKKKLKEVKSELEKYVSLQEESTTKTKQQFVSLKDKMFSKRHLWDDSQPSKDEKRDSFLDQGFSKQYDSMTNFLSKPNESMSDINFIEIEGTVRESKLDRHIQDNTLMMFREHLRHIWVSNLNTWIVVHKTVTQNGVQLLNVDEDQVSQKFISPFFQIMYDKSFFFVRKTLENCAKAYGMHIAVEIAVKKLLKPKMNPSTTETKVLKHTVTKQGEHDETTGLNLAN